MEVPHKGVHPPGSSLSMLRPSAPPAAAMRGDGACRKLHEFMCFLLNHRPRRTAPAVRAAARSGWQRRWWGFLGILTAGRGCHRARRQLGLPGCWAASPRSPWSGGRRGTKSPALTTANFTPILRDLNRHAEKKKKYIYNNGRKLYQFLPGRPIYDPPRQGNYLYFLYLIYLICVIFFPIYVFSAQLNIYWNFPII